MKRDICIVLAIFVAISVMLFFWGEAGFVITGLNMMVYKVNELIRNNELYRYLKEKYPHLLKRFKGFSMGTVSSYIIGHKAVVEIEDQELADKIMKFKNARKLSLIVILLYFGLIFACLIIAVCSR
jgi:hypothetical protein